MGRKSSSSRSGTSQKGKSYAKLFEKMTILKSKVKTLQSRKSTITNNAVSEILKHKFKVSQLEKDGRIVFVSIYIYICRLTMAHAVQRQQAVLPDGPYSVHWGVCRTPQCPGRVVSAGWCEACWAAHVAWHGRGFVPPEFALRSVGIRRNLLMLQIARLRGVPLALDSFFYILFLSRPTGRRTMAHRSHGHMGRQGGRGCPPLVIYIYFYSLRELL